MTYHGHVRNGKVEIEGSVRLPEGAVIELRIVDADGEGGNGQELSLRKPSLDEELDRIWGDVPDSEWSKLPADLCEQLDHHLYGTPKR